VAALRDRALAARALATYHRVDASPASASRCSSPRPHLGARERRARA